MHRKLWLLLAIFIVGTTVQSFVFPPMEGSDEPLHFAYVAYLRTERHLPERSNYLENCTRQQSGQPPLTYWLAAVLLDALRFPPIGCDAVYDYYYHQTDNRWLLSPRPMRRDDNNTNFLPVTSMAPPEGMPAALYVVRLISVVFGAVGVMGAYLAAGEVFKRESWRLTATIIFAFMPTYFHLSAYFSNDPSATAFTTLVVWRILHLMNRGITTRRLLIIGLLIGLGSLCKASVFLIAPAVALAVILVRRSVFMVIRDGLIIVAPIVLTFGVWVGWGFLRYGDPLGTGTHVHPVLRYDPPLGVGQLIRALPDIYMTYIGLLGYANVYMHPMVYAALTAVIVLAVWGYLFGKEQSSITPAQGWIFLVFWGAIFMGFVDWYRVIYDVSGRLMLPAHIIFALVVTAGLAKFSRGQFVVRVMGAGIFITMGTVFTFTSLQAAYAPRFVEVPPPLQGNAFDFDDTIRLLGYVHDGKMDDDIDTITLCWEVLQPTDRLAAYAVRYVKDGAQIANRTTVHGLGKYNSTLWDAGKIFCDAVDMAVGDALFGGTPPEIGATYDILVVMLDVQTLDVNWQANTLDDIPVQFPILGQVTYRE